MKTNLLTLIFLTLSLRAFCQTPTLDKLDKEISTIQFTRDSLKARVDNLTVQVSNCNSQATTFHPKPGTFK